MVFFLQNGPKCKEYSQLPLTKFPLKSYTNAFKSFFLLARKRNGRSVIARQNCNRWQQ